MLFFSHRTVCTTSGECPSYFRDRVKAATKMVASIREILSCHRTRTWYGGESKSEFFGKQDGVLTPSDHEPSLPQLLGERGRLRPLLFWDARFPMDPLEIADSVLCQTPPRLAGSSRRSERSFGNSSPTNSVSCWVSTRTRNTGIPIDVSKRGADGLSILSTSPRGAR